MNTTDRLPTIRVVTTRPHATLQYWVYLGATDVLGRFADQDEAEKFAEAARVTQRHIARLERKVTR
jgi:hypothetical protein